MEGKNKQIAQENPASSDSTFPKIPILAANGNTVRPSNFMSPPSFRLPRSPTSFNYFSPKPFFISRASSSGTTPATCGFLPRPEPFFMNKTVAAPTTPGTSNNEATPAVGGFFPRSEPYLMNKVVASPTTHGTSSSGPRPVAGGLIPSPEPFSMRAEKEKMDQNQLPPLSQNMTIDNSATTEVAIPVKGRVGRKPDPNMESRKLKRIMSNRQSAQRSRIKKLQHLYDMEKKAESLGTLVNVLSSQVQLQKNKQYLMTIEKSELENRIAACANRKLVVDGEIEARIEEINRLRLNMGQRYHQIQPQNMGDWGHGQSTEQMMDPSLDHYGNDESNQVDAGDEYMSEMSMLDNLHLHQESHGNNITNKVPGWEVDEGRLTNVGLGQSGVEQLANPNMNQQLEQNQMESLNSSMGELQQIFKFNAKDDVNPSNGFI